MTGTCIAQIRMGDHLLNIRELTPAEWQNVHEHITYEMLGVLSRKIKTNSMATHGSCVGVLTPDATTLYDKSRALFKEMAQGAITVTIKATAVLNAKHSVCGDIPVSSTLTLPLFFFSELIKSSGESAIQTLAKEVALAQLKDTFTSKALEDMYVRHAVISLF